MFDKMSSWELLIRWGKKNGLSVREAIGQILHRLVNLDAWRNLQNRDTIHQQVEIERLDRQVTDLKARVKLLEEQVSLRRKENGTK